MFQSERNEILETLDKKIFITDEMLQNFSNERGLQGRSFQHIKNKFLEEKLADMFGQYKLDQKKNKDSFWRRMLDHRVVELFKRIDQGHFSPEC
jgi:hypothetical protein